MYKPLVILCVVFCVIEARPKWQFLPPRDGYVPVYIQTGDTPLEEINPELAEAFHALPAGRSAGGGAGKHDIEAAADNLDIPEQADQPRESPESPEEYLVVSHLHEKKGAEKKVKKPTDIVKPIERR